MHKHYEKLYPTSKLNKNQEEFVPISYFTDFLVVHPYNTKGSRQLSNLEIKKQQNNMSQYLNEDVTNTNPMDSSRHFPANNENNRADNIIYSMKKQFRSHTRMNTSRTTARVGEFDLNHIFLINKCNLFC